MAAAEVPQDDRFGQLLDEYTQALTEYLASNDPAAILRADELGREAVASGHSALAVAAAHHRATAAVLLRGVAQQDRSDTIKALSVFCSSCPAWLLAPHETSQALEAFFRRVLEPFEHCNQLLRESNSVLRRMQDLREQEARRIAHILHDDIAQSLASLQWALDDADCDDGPSRRKRLQAVRGMLDDLDDRLRQLSHEIRPTILDDLGLTPALELLVQGMSKRSGIRIRLESELGQRQAAEVETALYRIVQETLTNALKHAGASFISVRLCREGDVLSCSVRDNGRGFDTAPNGRPYPGLGLLGIRERLEPLGGSLEIISKPGRGTELSVRMPWTKRAQAAGVGSRSAADAGE